MLGIFRRYAPLIAWPWLPLGLRGEIVAAAYVRRAGYKLLYRSYRCGIGELDIVAIDGETLVFIEVRTRTDAVHGEAWETIGARKQHKLSALANYFLKHEKEWQHRPTRFDVVSVEWPIDTPRQPKVTLYRDAFSVRGSWLNG